MKKSFAIRAELLYQKLKEYWRSPNRWFVDTPERALLDAYEAAQRIKNIEIEHFDGKKISSASGKYTENVMSYWQVYLDKNLTIIKIRLAEFTLSRAIIDISNSALLEKLRVIDEIVEKYAIKNKLIDSQPQGINQSKIKNSPDSFDIKEIKTTSPFQKTGVFPGSIGRSINVIKGDFSPHAEENFTRNYRLSRNRTRIALRFFLILILVPLVTQHLSKELLVNPIVEKIRGENTTQIFINSDMEKEALQKLRNFQAELRFEYLLNQTPQLSSTAVQQKIKDRASEIAEEFRIKSNSSISNVFADLISLISFALVISFSKKEIVVVKAFIDNIVYGLSDSAKAFLIILFTDIFVGFHSPHGWEIVLEGFSEHLGLPANNNVIFLFIATFPVILNTIFKYWIFRYLSRLSPSALATLKEMDE
ncbi:MULTISPECIES: proton extrusion protein PcxA [Nostoc]|uniref:Proton extrusion protein PxcA n=1 Tax=Nostoc paludosum FACHB-159 TaxID=2692908 RepID=A0ABR8KBR9_9NOSO|nr:MULTISPECIES: proton extrusion protein PcxA [Nostoc]MBD2680590.1 proton extrusion protein PcxA [Nostoc sp. FACHB-857]MBD2736982.1 proton extrusion protein PcxA [Nostoc paludosum FACHB-159]